ncbi:rubredoxin [Streptomyces malaysiense]|uniref:Rubredoxin n=1 Tax=Streptomyces malaysiense TaxID=1428626 RepID=A0A1J4Q5G3_9ACTN|nr:rubredoxin [Streptomyces malaysiense]OIK28451.1 rubredoxin [Streptomyces malaysiense]
MSDTPGKRAWMCLLCGWVYYEALGLPEEGIAPGTPWEEIPDTWECPACGASKEDFVMEQL